MEIRLANLKDVEQIVAFHTKQFKDYYLTQLGQGILNDYYRFFIDSVDNKCFISTTNGEIIGLALFVEDFETQISTFYSQHKVLLAKRILFSLLRFNRVVWQGTFERVKNMFTISNVDPNLPRLTLLSLAVSGQFRGQGIGRSLLEFAEKYYQQQEVASYYLSVLNDNDKAIAFYEKNGFNKIKQKERLYYMEKVIV